MNYITAKIPEGVQTSSGLSIASIRVREIVVDEGMIPLDVDGSRYINAVLGIDAEVCKSPVFRPGDSIFVRPRMAMTFTKFFVRE